MTYDGDPECIPGGDASNYPIWTVDDIDFDNPPDVFAYMGWQLYCGEILRTTGYGQCYPEGSRFVYQGEGDPCIYPHIPWETGDNFWPTSYTCDPFFLEFEIIDTACGDCVITVTITE